MFNYSEWKRINGLIKAGNQFLNDRALITHTSQIRIWLAAVSDTVLPKLPAEGSYLRAEFRRLLDFLKDENKIYTDEKLRKDKEKGEAKLKDLVRNAISILEYARGLPGLNRTSSEALHESENISTERLSEDKIPSDLTETERNGLEREIRYYISEHYFQSWWFRIPIIILGITVVFAILGVIQINNFKISVQEITDNAVERAKQDINAEVESIRSDLKGYTAGEKESISSDVRTYREELKQQKTQATQVLNEMTTRLTDLNPEVASLEKRQETLENRILPLEQAFEVINEGTERGLWFDAVAILNNSLIVVGATLLVSCIALIVSLISFWRTRRR